jgi:uncharacterized protein YlxW (UPF0749 family)
MKMIKTIIVIMACSVIACSLFFIKSVTATNSEGTAAAGIVSASEQKMQSQVSDLSAKVSNFNDIVSRLQSQAVGSAAASSADQQVLSKIDAVTADAKNLASQVDTLKTQIAALENKNNPPDSTIPASGFDLLQKQVAELQDRLQVAETSIGNTPVTVDGLSIVFITKCVEIGVTGSSLPNVGQFAIKIINTTGTVLNSVDVTGTITGSLDFSDYLAAGYPQLVDGAGLCSYVFFMTQGQTLHFEAFGNAKTSLSIPPGGSITLRPKISVLAAAKQQLPDMTFNLALETVSFDNVAAK